MSLRYDIDILDSGRPDLDELGDKARDMKPAMAAILRLVIVPRYKARFSGTGWKPLTPGYREQKAQQGLDPRVGRATGALEAALTAMNRTTGRTQSVGKTAVRVGVGKKLFYARFFNAERELFGWEPADERVALKVLDGFLFSGRAGLA